MISPPTTSPPPTPSTLASDLSPPAVPVEKGGPVADSSVRLTGFFAGVCSGLTKLAVGHPFDTIKTRLQCAPPGTYRSSLDCLLRTIRLESPLALYKGASPPAVGWMITDAVLLGSLHNYRLWLLRHGWGEGGETETGVGREGKGGEGAGAGRLGIGGQAVAGWGAGMSNAVFAHPIELLKAKLQLQLGPASVPPAFPALSTATSTTFPPTTPSITRPMSTIAPPSTAAAAAVKPQFSGPIDCAAQVVRAQGPLGLYRGFSASLLFRSNFAWMFGGYEACIRAFEHAERRGWADVPTSWRGFVAGGMGANAFWLGALPADNIKNRIQTDSLSSPRYNGIASVVRVIYAEAGLKGFYRGFVPVALRAFPTNAAALFVYEHVMHLSGAEATR